ncbi:hypothetical protein [Streptomyces alanosinicus]|uniref:Uncharacterized protein n=1 Tax=Streptomyces alanosinicus TaxID=68171 RepID=A0A918YT63_9ACTN|nr:hypothetical protein [Streptomyces alanosinicus]GHE14945.1 hypothetical protein GCM10010339_87930 [Streptomyces alanosinicus]
MGASTHTGPPTADRGSGGREPGCTRTKESPSGRPGISDDPIGCAAAGRTAVCTDQVAEVRLPADGAPLVRPGTVIVWHSACATPLAEALTQMLGTSTP